MSDLRNNDVVSPTDSVPLSTSSSTRSTSSDSNPDATMFTPLETPEEAESGALETAAARKGAQSGDGHAALDPSARALVRLLQCAQCSLPLRDPVTLACGNSLCKQCLPEIHVRTNISYPATAARLQGFTCPFADCGKDHALGDCGRDVTLGKIMELVRKYVDDYEPVIGEAILLLEERDKWSVAGVANLRGRAPRSKVLPGGRLIASYKMAAMGELSYDSEITYTPVSGVGAGAESQTTDAAVLEALRTISRSELDCQICYALLLSPLTTPCGHTFCRACLQRVLDHSAYCPICRTHLSLSPSLPPSQHPSNTRLDGVLSMLHGSALAARRAAESQNELRDAAGALDTPLFICTLSFPTAPTFLHIFEPRYRLLVRRALAHGGRTFGMVLDNPRQVEQPGLGAVPFYEVGTLLHILNFEGLPDGRSLIETVGVSRLRVKRTGVLDGYMVGEVEKIEDVSVAEEEALEIAETSAPSGAAATLTETATEPETGASVGDTSSAAVLARLPTAALLAICTSFVARHRAASAPWLHRRVIAAYGEPPADAARFSWWFAAVLPVADAEKVAVLGMRSVRQRLRAEAGWAERLERARE